MCGPEQALEQDGVVHVGRRRGAGYRQVAAIDRDVVLGPPLAQPTMLRIAAGRSGWGRSGRRRAWRAPSNCPRSGRRPGR